MSADESTLHSIGAFVCAHPSIAPAAKGGAQLRASMDLYGLYGESSAGVGLAIATAVRMPSVQRDPVASIVIAAAIEVHRCLGPGLLETVYQTCLAYQLSQSGLDVKKEVAVPVMFNGIRMDCGFRLDFLVDGGVIVEVKSVDQLAPIHSAQVLTYLRLTEARQALLFNFNSVTLMAGMKSFLGNREVPSR